MPRHYELICGACGEGTWCNEATTWIDLDDGGERIVGHPGEVRRIEAWTGQSFHEVLDAERLHYARLLVCLTCGSAEDYRDDQVPALRRDADYLTADEIEAERRRAQDDFRQRDPEKAERAAERKVGLFYETTRSPQLDEAATKSHRQYRRLLGKIDEGELSQVACRVCGDTNLHLFDVVVSQALDGDFLLRCPGCGEGAASLSPTMRMS